MMSEVRALKELKRQIKLYFMNSLYLPGVLLSAVTFCVTAGLILKLTKYIPEPDEISEKVDLTIIMGLSYYHLSVLLFFIQTMSKVNKHKFFRSMPRARQYSVILPIISALAMSVICDIIMNCCIAFGAGFLNISAAIIINAIATSVICFAVGVLDKPILQPVGLCIIPAYFMVLSKGDIPVLTNTNIPIPAAIATAVLIYAAGTAVSILVMKLYWKYSQRDHPGNSSISAKSMFSFSGK